MTRTKFFAEAERLSYLPEAQALGRAIASGDAAAIGAALRFSETAGAPTAGAQPTEPVRH